MSTSPVRTLALLLVVLLMLPPATGCTVLKPVACGVVVPIAHVANRLDQDDDDDEDYNDLPALVLLSVAPILIPLNYVYYTLYGAFGGLVSGFVSDLNLITGHGSFRNSKDTIFKPMRTNAVE